MQGMVVVGLIVEELSNINVKCVKYRSRSPGQGAESVHREEAIYKVWWLKALQLRTYGRAT